MGRVGGPGGDVGTKEIIVLLLEPVAMATYKLRVKPHLNVMPLIIILLVNY